jgi:hypothetical protein
VPDEEQSNRPTVRIVVWPDAGFKLITMFSGRRSVAEIKCRQQLRLALGFGLVILGFLARPGNPNRLVWLESPELVAVPTSFSDYGSICSVMATAIRSTFI